MPVGVMMPQKKDKSGTFGTIGSIAGMAIGGPMGGAVGGALGRRLGGSQQSAAADLAPVAESAMSRRFQAQQEPDHSQTIGDGLEALKTAPPEIQKQYAPVMIQAQMQAERQPPRYSLGVNTRF